LGYFQGISWIEEVWVVNKGVVRLFYFFKIWRTLGELPKKTGLDSKGITIGSSLGELYFNWWNLNFHFTHLGKFGTLPLKGIFVDLTWAQKIRVGNIGGF